MLNKEDIVVEEVIAQGGFGRVERVRLEDGAKVARKVYCLAFKVEPEEEKKLKKRFKREVKVQSQLSEKFVMPVLGADLDADDPWFLMPLAERNLAQEIADSRTLGKLPSKALADVLNALEELHRLGFVHRDLKPHNILLHDGAWKLSDFGLVLPPAGMTTKLTSLEGWGTEEYCAPEQKMGFRSVTAAADIYAFGCILHDIFGTPPRLPYRRHTAAGEIGAIIEKCTEIKADKRFKGVGPLRSVLLTLLTKSTVPASPTAASWGAALKSAGTWDDAKLEEFVRYLREAEEQGELYSVCHELDEEMFGAFHKRDKALCKEIALIYCDWVRSSSFQFEFCDVLALRLRQLFDIGDLECKAAAVMAGAGMAYDHNRWFVMGQVMDMCDATMEDAAAERIAIEIEAQEAHAVFMRCAEGIGRPLAAYHERIAAVMSEN